MKLEWLGDVLGPLRYLGACVRCRAQFMSQRERCAVLPGGGLVCERCVRKEGGLPL